MILQSTNPLALWGLTSSAWLTLWSVLAAMTLVLVLLLRTRWSNARPMRKCAILSLWVHVLLAVAATTVRVISGAPDSGNDVPIRVSIMPVLPSTDEEPIEDQITPEWEQPKQIAMVPPEPAPVSPPEQSPLPDGPDSAAIEQVTKAPPTKEPAPPLEAPTLLAAPSPAESTEQEQPDEPTETLTENSSPTPTELAEETPEDIAETDSPLNDVVPENPTPELAEAAPPTPPVAHEPQPLVPSTYSDRFAHDRDQIAEQRGGSQLTEEAVQAALGWLATTQSRNGGWDASRYGAGQERAVLGHNRQGSGANADMGITGLALLAFLGSGHTHLSGPYANEVANGLEYLRQRQRSDGSLYGDAQLFARMYCHSMATFAVCEAYALTGDKRLAPMAKAAVAYALSMQHPTDGGWRYRRGDTGDTSQLGWQLMALKSAELAQIEIPSVTWTRIERFLRKVKRGPSGGLAAYRPVGPASRTMTAEALFCRQLLYSRSAMLMDPSVAQEASLSMLEELPTPEKRNLYFWYYATMALHGNQHQSPEAAQAWDQWNHALTTALLATQRENGSWDEDTVWGGYGGQIYTTALSAMCLEVYYRYSPNESPQEFARRKGWNSVQR